MGNALSLEEQALAFEELKIQEKELKEKIDILKKEIEASMELDQELVCSSGTITKIHRPRWKYSNNVETAKKSLKELEAEEVAKGIAIDGGTDFIQYNHNKNVEQN